MIEAKQNELTVVGQYRQSGRKVEMRMDAAIALENMMTEAHRAGIEIIPISGFRSVEYQAKLFALAATAPVEVGKTLFRPLESPTRNCPKSSQRDSDHV